MDWKDIPAGGLTKSNLVFPLAVDAFARVYRKDGREGSPFPFALITLSPEAANRMGPEIASDLTRELAARLADSLEGTAVVAYLYPGSRELIVIGSARDAREWFDRVAGAVSQLVEDSELVAYAVSPTEVLIAVAEVRPHPGADPAIVFDSAVHRLAAGIHDGVTGSSAWAGYPDRLGDALRDALQGRGLGVARQPIVRLSDRAIHGYEALIRGPQGSPVEQPEVLFALVGKHGALRQMERICRETILRFDPAQLVDGHRLFLNVNPIAPLQELIDVLQQRGYETGRLVVEISEKSFFNHAARLTRELEALRALGVRAALDDVGTGHTGLKILAMFPWDYIKIDASVIRHALTDPRLAALCRALNGYAGETGASLVAEGIETPEQHAFCLDLGLELGQGYLFGRPVLWGDG